MRLPLITLAVAALGMSAVQAGIVSVRAIDTDVEIVYTTSSGLPEREANHSVARPPLPLPLPLTADSLRHISIRSFSYGGRQSTIRCRLRDAKMAAELAAALEAKRAK